MTYSMRANAPGVRSHPPPLKLVERLADGLGLKGGERERFILLAALEHAPEVVRQQMKRIENEIENLRVDHR